MDNEFNILVNSLQQADRVAVLTGAGISAESGIPTFRGKDGLWNKYDPMQLASNEAFTNDPHLVWEWYEFRRNIVQNALPNPGHIVLAKMEKHFSQFTLTTQNVDGLHARAGNSNILELHGNINSSRCNSCGYKSADVRYIKDGPLPQCVCGGLYRPDVVWFGESLPQQVLQNAFDAAMNVDLYLVVGTSSLVYPAAYLPQEAKKNGAFVAEINLQTTALTPFTDVSLFGKSGELLPQIWDRI